MYHVHRVIHWIRHLPIIKHATPLWNWLRPWYWCILDWRNKGLPIHIARAISARIPKEYINFIDWNNYEADTLSKLKTFLQSSKDIGMVDLGSFIGIFTLVVLHSNPRSIVIAWDSEPANVSAVLDLCQHATQYHQRIIPIVGYATNTVESINTWDQIIQYSRKLIAPYHGQSLIGKVAYRNLVDLPHESHPLPCYTLDSLMLNCPISPKGGWILKCDIEGAELLALQGATQWLDQARPIILLSVHKTLIHQFNSTTYEVERFLTDRGYTITKLGDYYQGEEQSWWCEPSTQS